MKRIPIISAIIISIITFYVTWSAFYFRDESILAIGTFIVISVTLIVLIWYAYDTNSIAKITRERWIREGVLSTTYSMELNSNKGDRGQTLFKIINPTTLVVRAKVNCNFKIYGQSVSAGDAYDGKENWLLFPQQTSIGWFEIESLLQKKEKSVATMITEYSSEKAKEQLTMDLMLEFWDELGIKRELPQRFHYFDFNRWAWIPQLTEKRAST